MYFLLQIHTYVQVHSSLFNRRKKDENYRDLRKWKKQAHVLYFLLTFYDCIWSKHLCLFWMRQFHCLCTNFTRSLFLYIHRHTADIHLTVFCFIPQTKLCQFYHKHIILFIILTVINKLLRHFWFLVFVYCFFFFSFVTQMEINELVNLIKNQKN